LRWITATGIFFCFWRRGWCSAEITYKTDPKNSGYELESGASRKFGIMEQQPGAPQAEGGERIIMEAFQKNMTQIELLRTVMSLATGALCGILGLTGSLGLAFYLLTSVIIGVAIAGWMSFDTKSFANTTLIGLILQGLQGQALSFIMTWTLAYSLVYIY